MQIWIGIIDKFLRLRTLMFPMVIVNPCKIGSTNFGGKNKIYRGVKLKGSSIGRGTYIAEYSSVEFAKVGKYCSIAPYVEIIKGKHPIHSFVSSHPAFFSPVLISGFSYVKDRVFEDRTLVKTESGDKSIVIGNDVWIGYGVKILEGITIGNGAIIGAFSLVTKDVPCYSIVRGIPAKVIRYRFEDKQIDALIGDAWWNKEDFWLLNNSGKFANIEEYLEFIGHESK